MLDIFRKASIIIHVPDAGVAHPVERHLAKVEVASSSLVTRSIKEGSHFMVIFLLWIGQKSLERLEKSEKTLDKTEKHDIIIKKFGPVVQSVSTPACHAGGRRFESVRGRHNASEWSVSSARYASVAQ